MGESIAFDQIDWAQSWIDIQKHRADPSDSSKWDKRAESFSQRSKSAYSQRFIELLELEPKDTVLDMGCGTGELALQIAQSGHKVFARDFSEGMLSYLRDSTEKMGLNNLIDIAQMSWSDDWASCGIGSKSVDVVIASRSIMVPDLGSTLELISNTARKKVAVTLAVEGSPSVDATLAQAIGRKSVGEYDTIYCINMLFQMGYTPELRYINSDKNYLFATVEEACEDSLKRVSNPTPAEREEIIEFTKQHLQPYVAEDGSEVWRLSYQRFSKWAFISWEV